MDLLDAITLETPVFLESREFAEPLAWGVVTADCIFNDDHVLLESDEGAPVSSRQPRATIHLSDFSGIATGETVTYKGVDYIVRDIQKDGTQTGDAILWLST